uniref:Uncharacterized protein LOC114344343 n=1 Tax=Diabrotica virgifera virgifera TaxID=50390 RepID=A0A6P7GMW7_DIAVI
MNVEDLIVENMMSVVREAEILVEDGRERHFYDRFRLDSCEDGSLLTPNSHHLICSDHFVGGEKSDTEMSSSYVPSLFCSQTLKARDVHNIDSEDGSLLTPNSHHLICSDHFVGGEKSDAEMSPSYVPSLFGSQTLKARYVHNIDRHSRFMKRRIQSMNGEMMKSSTGEILGPTKDCEISSSSSNEISVQTEEYTTDNLCEIESFNNSVVNSSADKSCQVFIWEDDDGSPKPWKESFVCIKYVHKDSVDVEIQTDISGDIDLVTARKHKKLKNKMCGTDHKTYADVAVGLIKK